MDNPADSFPLGPNMTIARLPKEQDDGLPRCGTIADIRSSWTGESVARRPCENPPTAKLYWMRPPHVPNHIWPVLEVRASLICSEHLREVQEHNPEWIRHIAQDVTDA